MSGLYKIAILVCACFALSGAVWGDFSVPDMQSTIRKTIQTTLTPAWYETVVVKALYRDLVTHGITAASSLFIATCALFLFVYDYATYDGYISLDRSKFSEWMREEKVQHYGKILIFLTSLVSLGLSVRDLVPWFISTFKKDQKRHMDILLLQSVMQLPGCKMTISDMKIVDEWFKSFKKFLIDKKLVVIVDEAISYEKSSGFVSLVGEKSIEKMERIENISQEYKRKDQLQLFQSMIKEILDFIGVLRDSCV